MLSNNKMQLKEGLKRIKNDDFEQVEKCETCGKLFWARSELELGNWQKDCKPCRIRFDRETAKKEKYIKEFGTPRFGFNGQIFAWTLEGENVFNFDYKPSERLNSSGRSEYEVWANGFIDIDKFDKDFGSNK